MPLSYLFFSSELTVNGCSLITTHSPWSEEGKRHGNRRPSSHVFLLTCVYIRSMKHDSSCIPERVACKCRRYYTCILYPRDQYPPRAIIQNVIVGGLESRQSWAEAGRTTRLSRSLMIAGEPWYECFLDLYYRYISLLIYKAGLTRIKRAADRLCAHGAWSRWWGK